jgi:hypothetical protein
MKGIHAIWKDGRIVPSQPVDWPDGTALSVEPLECFSVAEAEGELLGDDPASIARWIAYFDALPHLRMSDAEEAEWQAARRDMRDYTIAKMRERSGEDRP